METVLKVLTDIQLGTRIDPQTINQAVSEVGEITDILANFEKDERVIHTYHRTFAQRLTAMLRFYKDIAVNHLRGSKSLRDDMLVYLRAMSMIVSQAANAGTHSEKNARLRGAIEMCETAGGELRKEEFNFNDRFYFREDIFRSDYPVRHYIERIHELEREIESLKQPAGEAQGVSNVQTLG